MPCRALQHNMAAYNTVPDHACHTYQSFHAGPSACPSPGLPCTIHSPSMPPRFGTDGVTTHPGRLQTTGPALRMTSVGSAAHRLPPRNLARASCPDHSALRFARRPLTRRMSFSAGAPHHPLPHNGQAGDPTSHPRRAGPEHPTLLPPRGCNILDQTRNSHLNVGHRPCTKCATCMPCDCSVILACHRPMVCAACSPHSPAKIRVQASIDAGSPSVMVVHAFGSSPLKHRVSAVV